MPFFLVFSSTYTVVDLALYQENSLLGATTLDKHKASKLLIVTIDALLQQHQLSIGKIACFIVNQGPAPFTTLRTVITTVNGLAFASNIPIIGVNGLEAFLEEHNTQNGYTIALLNAFSQEVYFGICKNANIIQTGCQNYAQFLQNLFIQISAHESITFIGNAASMYREQVHALFGTQAIFPDPLPEYVSVDAIAHSGIEKYQHKTGLSKQVVPLYIKSVTLHQK